jgi:hypothetical protein
MGQIAAVFPEGYMDSQGLSRESEWSQDLCISVCYALLREAVVTNWKRRVDLAKEKES